MASGAGSPFTLRPAPADDRKPKNLSEFIARVNVNKGGFRNLREEDLRKELEAQKNGMVDSTNADSSDDSDNGDNADPESDNRAARDEILKDISTAHNAAVMALDFVSLLLSKETPVQADMTLTPQLRELVGIGTLGATNLSSSNQSRERLQDKKLVATGRKLLDINMAADSILSAASRLQKEISLETKYWAEVRAVSDSGWTVCRMPQDTQTMGVKFGFSESGADFKASSLAPMRKLEDGSVKLDTGRLGGDSKRLLVSVVKDGKVVGRSPLPQLQPKDAPLEQRVLEARNSIFAEELWYEMNREGRTLLSYGVRLDASTVTCTVDSDTDIVFRLVTLGDDEYADMDVTPESNPENINAETISTVLYLLLCYGHRQNGRKRPQQPAPSATQGRPTNPPHYLLRPIVTYLNFENSLRRCVRFLSDLTAILHSAGITTAAYTLSEQPISLKSPSRASESLLALLLIPLTFRIELTITPETRLEILGTASTTQFVAGLYHVGLLAPGTQDEVAVKLEDGSQPAPSENDNPLLDIFPPNDNYPSLDDVFVYLLQAVPRILADKCEGLTEGWTTSVDGKAVRDRDTEDRGVAFELSDGGGSEGQEDGNYGVDVVVGDGGSSDPYRPRELRVTGDLFVDNKPSRKSWAWSLEDARAGTAKEKLEDAVREVLLCPRPQSAAAAS